MMQVKVALRSVELAGEARLPAADVRGSMLAAKIFAGLSQCTWLPWALRPAGPDRCHGACGKTIMIRTSSTKQDFRQPDWD
jgi:hypothetical protein